MPVAKRLTQALADFAARVLAKGPAAAAAVVAFLETLIRDAVATVRQTDAGPVVSKAVTLGALAKMAALPALDGPLAMHAEIILERIGNEIEARGAMWQKEGLHVALNEHLIKPLKAAEPDLEARVSALEAVVSGPAPEAVTAVTTPPAPPAE